MHQRFDYRSRNIFMYFEVQVKQSYIIDEVSTHIISQITSDVLVHFQRRLRNDFRVLKEAIVHEGFIIFPIEQNNRASSHINVLQTRWFRDRIFVHIQTDPRTHTTPIQQVKVKSGRSSRSDWFKYRIFVHIQADPRAHNNYRIGKGRERCRPPSF